MSADDRGMPPSQALFSARDRLLAECSEELSDLKEAGLLRRLTTLEAVDGPRVRLNGREVIQWCSNDYLGLSGHPRLVAAAAHAGAAWGVGARASRLLAGTTLWHTRLEEALAAWFGTEAAIVYPSGYMANLGTLGALLSSQDAVFVDRLCHASLFDAARATRATLRVFRHNDVDHLASLLKRVSRARRRFIVTEGVFSMEGDVPPLADVVGLALAHDATVYLDDAHGTFVLGDTGRGTPEATGVSIDQILYMGTLGKALGTQGGFVVGPGTLINVLQNRARTFIYTTALAIPVVAAALEALQLLGDEPERREQLRVLATSLYRRLAPLNRIPLVNPSHILPVMVGDARRALALAAALWERGIWAPAIRPPTVPEGTARLRLGLTVLHSEAHIDQLAVALQDAKAVHSPRSTVHS